MRARDLTQPQQRQSSEEEDSLDAPSSKQRSSWLLSNSASGGGGVNRSPRTYHRAMSPLDLQHHCPAPSAPPLGPLPEDEDAPPIIVTASPGTPPKKVWERSYRNFLKMGNYQNNKLHQGSDRSDNSSAAGSARQRTSSLSAVAASDSDKESSIRGGKLFANVFRGSSSGNASSPNNLGRRNKAKSLSSGELDGTLRRGTEKAYSPGNARYRPVVQVPTTGTESMTSTSLPQHMLHSTGPSGRVLVPSRASEPPAVLDHNNNLILAGGAGPLLLRPRTSSREDYSTTQQQIDLALAMDAAGARNSSFGPTTFAQRFSNDATTMITEPPEPPEPPNLNPPEPPNLNPGFFVTAQENSSSFSSSAMKKAFTEFHNSSSTGRDAVSAYLGDDTSHRQKGGIVQESAGHSLAWTQNQQKLATAHLKDNKCASQENLKRHVSEGNHDMNNVPSMMAMATPSSLNGLLVDSTERRRHLFLKQQTEPVDACHSNEGPLLETAFENVSIHKELRMLKPIQSVDAWQTGRRYLIAPAALTACPLNVLNVLAGNKEPLSAHQASSQEAPYAFGTILLGECLLSCSSSNVGNRNHSTTVKQPWSSAVLVVRQNYLLEYSPGVGTRGLPRGYAHLQYAQCYTNADFPDALELHFYGSPCAKADKRVLMIRVQRREERDDWKQCLNRAVSLRVEDLYEYDEKNPIGKGSYASVYKGRRKLGTSSTVDHLCALKVFDKNQYWRMVVKGQERADTLVRETSVQATVTAKCGRIPSSVRILGFFETSDVVVVELELLEGTDLFKYISSRGVLKEADAAHLVYDILHCLDAMNRIGLAHRDIKPANILMCQGRHGSACKVADFGMATFVGVDGQLRGRCGTPGYVAPEIFTAGVHGGYGNKVDVFSVGVTMYVMLCGFEPFYGETDAELIQANKEAAIDFPDEEWKDISEAARDLVQKMMQPDPKKRLDCRGALKHPWFQTHLPDVGAVLDRSNTLPVAEAPADDACVIT